MGDIVEGKVAGVGIGVAMLVVVQEVYDWAMDVMARGVFLGMTHGIRAMQKTGNGGAIANWSLRAELNASPGSRARAAGRARVHPQYGPFRPAGHPGGRRGVPRVELRHHPRRLPPRSAGGLGRGCASNSARCHRRSPDQRSYTAPPGSTHISLRGCRLRGQGHLPLRPVVGAVFDNRPTAMLDIEVLKRRAQQPADRRGRRPVGGGARS